MNEMAKELNMYGYDSAEAVFRHGLNSLKSSQASLKADRANPLKYQIDRIVNDMHDIRIAENVLREWFGIRFCEVGTHKAMDGLGIQIHCGIDEVANALDRNPEEKDEWGLKKSFSYDWCDFTQLAERNSTEYLKAFAGNPSNYSTTYEKVYGNQ
jgi:hypothetical protein